MSLRQGMPAGAGCRFRESFLNSMAVQEQSGVIVASTVDRGISPLGISARVTYDQTQALLINASQMTIAMRLRTGAAVAPLGYKIIVSKTPSTFTNNQFFVQRISDGRLTCYIANAAADTANVFSTPILTPSTEYVVHFVYNGDLIAGLRGATYFNGAVNVVFISGALPARMRDNGLPLTIFNHFGGNASAPDNDNILREVAIYDFAMSPAEVSDDFARTMARKVTPE